MRSRIWARGGFVTLARQLLDSADLAMSILDPTGYNPWKNELELAVIFDRPPEWVVKKWSLSTQGDFCHLYAMRHTTRLRLEQLAEDLKNVSAVFAGAQPRIAKCYLIVRSSSNRSISSQGSRLRRFGGWRNSRPSGGRRRAPTSVTPATRATRCLSSLVARSRSSTSTARHR